ncbi:CT253 family lipoprotein [Chlamydia suis]|uniref:CT253 family lipoprotein n=1 Tax=Chlamydia suis TaxID=83559 RepID=UPI0009AF7656|nr:CT253 family lipoprotein [Chlamydia suis]
MRRSWLLASFSLLSLTATTLSSCSVSTSGSYNARLYTKGSKAKGVVAMLPVFYRTEKSAEILPWNLQAEFSEEICKRLHSSDKLLLIKHHAPAGVAAQFFSPTPNISPELAAQLLPAEFVVATEILEQKTTEDILNPSISASVRVRVFDIRHNKISMIYQEILNANQPLASGSSDYYRYGWRSKNFDSTPMGLMHQRLFREIVARVEGYVCANYS